MKIIRAKDYKDMSRKAANIISAQIIIKPNCVLGLATGSTPIGTYQQLVEWYNKGDLDFSEVTSVNLDEYKGLERTNEQSYYYFMHDNLFRHVNIDLARTHLPDGMEPDADKACADYDRIIGLGDLTAYWGGQTAADAGWSVGMYMAGFFPCMMFGIPGAAVAMIQSAKPAKRKAAIGLVGAAAVCAFICGVTEPFEFAFMFLAFPLYVVYAALYGIFAAVTVALGFRAGFCFSAGATDLIFSASLPAAAKTWLIIPIGIVAFVVFYLVFRFAIVKFDLKTPGREDDDVEAEKSVVLANNDFTQVAAIILEGLGGKENVASLDNCITRLRLEVKDYALVDEKKIKSAGVAGVIRPSKTSVQVIVGTKVQFVADEMAKMLK